MAIDPQTRPRLASHALPLLRSPGVLQLGIAADCALVLEGLSPAEVDFVEALDGTRSRDEVLDGAGGIVRAEEILDLLEVHGLLGHGPPRLAPRVVRVHGMGRVADGIATQLAGGRHVVQRIEGLPDGGGVPPEVRLIVVVAHRVLEPEVSHWVTTTAQLVLPVLHDGPSGTVGPLILPGHSPCPRCLDLTRRDHDPAWSHLVRQATSHHVRPDLSRTDPEPALVGLLSATATMIAAAALDGDSPLGVSLELSLPWPRPIQRQWNLHPLCGCSSALALASGSMGA